jgi:hypothetical protein
MFQGPSLTAAASYCQAPPDPGAGPGTLAGEDLSKIFAPAVSDFAGGKLYVW